MKLTSEQSARILAALREIEQCLNNIPYQHKLVTRVSTATHCKEQIQAIRDDMSGKGK